MKKLLSLRTAAIVIGTIAAMWLVIVHTASSYYTSKRPEVAVAFNSDNNFALSKLATAALRIAQAQSVDFEAASQLALRSVQAAPRDSDGLALLGFAADSGLFDTEGYPLVAKAQEYSKRSVVAQLYLIDHSLGQGDIEDALHYYDLALSTRPSSQTLLFPRLYAALAVERGQIEIIGLLQKDPPWKRGFWLGLSDLRPIPPYALDLYERVREDETAVVPGIAERFLRRLASEGRFAEAINMANMGGVGSSVVDGPRRLDDFVKERPAPPIDWSYQASGTHSAVPSADAMLLSVRGAKDVVFANRLTALPVGDAFTVSAVFRSDGGQGEWDLGLRCAESNAPLGSTAGSVQDEASTQAVIDPFTIPVNCPIQWLTISGRGEGMRNFDFAVQKIVVHRAPQ